jgi:predicted DNA binding CopG/RHH family protein
MSKIDMQEVLKKREYSKQYRIKHLNKDKKFYSARVSKEDGEEIKNFIKESGIPIKKIIEKGTEIMWKEIGGK